MVGCHERMLISLKARGHDKHVFGEHAVKLQKKYYKVEDLFSNKSTHFSGFTYAFL